MSTPNQRFGLAALVAFSIFIAFGAIPSVRGAEPNPPAVRHPNLLLNKDEIEQIKAAECERVADAVVEQVRSVHKRGGARAKVFDARLRPLLDSAT